MEIRDPVHGTIAVTDDEVEVINSPEYQRLRSIKQLGFSEFSFPGATHNRFLHSIGVCHLAGKAFDIVFSRFQFSSVATRERLRQCFRLAALLHDVGHGPLSHTTEEVMPQLHELKVPVEGDHLKVQRRANHEDYTLKYISDSPLTEVLKRQFSDIDPIHIICLIDKKVDVPDDFFVDHGVSFRPILSQLVSSELDVDRLDYLERDAYFCGTNYGRVESSWLLSNLVTHIKDDKIFLAIDRRALYTFDDFLISRHHMHLMVYFHHKSIIYEEMLLKYLTSDDCHFHLSPEINEYTKFNDYALYEHLAQSKNQWAKRIASRRPFQMLVDLHATEENSRAQKMKEFLESEKIPVIYASSQARLSKYHETASREKDNHIFVVDQLDKWDQGQPIEDSTKIFQMYEEARTIHRLYVPPEEFERARKLLWSQPPQGG